VHQYMYNMYRAVRRTAFKHLIKCRLILLVYRTLPVPYILILCVVVLLSRWESVRQSLAEAGATRQLLTDIRSATCSLRENILAVASADRPLDTLDQQQLTNRLHKFKVCYHVPIRLCYTISVVDPKLLFLSGDDLKVLDLDPK
jgi:hypothetical protein